MKEQIIKSVADLFQKYGVRSVSMDDIAQHLGISKKTIYQYFDDKNHLVMEVASLIIAEKLGAYQEVASSASNAIEELGQIAKLIRKHFSEMNPALMFDVRKYHPDAWQLFVHHEKEVVYNAIVDNITRGQKEGFFRKAIDSRVIAKLRFEQIHMSFDDEVFPKEEFDLQEVHLQLFDFFVHGVLTPHGLEQYKKYEFETHE
jgi:AcrR family transcriptional regulator